jgi:hypothetical protein
MNKEIENLKEENKKLTEEIIALKEKLNLYTNGERHKRYYKKNSEIVKQKAKEYMDKIKESNPDKLKEWRHTAYINRKEKLKNEKNNSV